MIPPKNNEIQLTVYGPGYGECILIHLGNKEWVVIDSCLENGKPAALSYFKEIGVNAADAVKAVIATHWHDDHTQGLHDTIKVCKSAKLIISSVFSDEDFLTLAFAVNLNFGKEGIGRGATEILSCINTIRTRNEYPVFAHENLEIWSVDKGVMAHNKPIQVLALSPSNAQVYEFLLESSKKLGKITNKSGLTPEDDQYINLNNKNSVSIATLINIGDFSILLGADVENNKNPKLGWKNIISNHKYRTNKPHILKSPHHGSINAYSKEFWSDLMKEYPITVVTAWNRGRIKLPTTRDLSRLRKHSKAVYLTSSNHLDIEKNYNQFQRKIIRTCGKLISSAENRPGSVSINLDSNFGHITKEILLGDAMKIF